MTSSKDMKMKVLSLQESLSTGVVKFFFSRVVGEFLLLVA
jgi:hypothetical protein